MALLFPVADLRRRHPRRHAQLLPAVRSGLHHELELDQNVSHRHRLPRREAHCDRSLFGSRGEDASGVSVGGLSPWPDDAG